LHERALRIINSIVPDEREITGWRSKASS